MFLLRADIMLGITTISSLLAPVIGVTLNQYTRPNCRGNRAYCSNINPGVCCYSPNRVFASGSCTGCTSTDFHTTWVQVSSRWCGRSAASTNGGSCISGSSNLRGHTWCRLCNTKRGLGLATEQNCTESVEPDVFQIDSTWIQLSPTVSQDVRDSVWAVWDNETLSADIPADLIQFQTEAPMEEDLADD